MSESVRHVNRTPFQGVLLEMDVASDKSPSGARGHKIVIPTSTARAALPTLVGMGINYSPCWGGHNPKRKIGIITKAVIRRGKLCVSGYLFGFDFPEVIEEIKKTEGLGMSYEMQEAHIEDVRKEEWTVTQGIFSGAAVLLRNKSAYRNTSFSLGAEPVSDHALKLSFAAIAKAEGGAVMAMTQQDALAEVQRRWGSGAIVVHYEMSGTFEVNSDPYSKYPAHWGKGESWEAAFSDAEKREQRK